MLHRALLVTAHGRSSLSLSWFVMLHRAAGPSSRGSGMSLLLNPLTHRLSSIGGRAVLQTCGGLVSSCAGGQLAVTWLLLGWSGAVARPLTSELSARVRSLIWG